MDTAARIDALAERGYDDELIGLLLGVERADVAEFRTGRRPRPTGSVEMRSFEINDRVIPAGTQFGDPPDVVADFTLPFGTLTMVASYVELAVPLLLPDKIGIAITNIQGLGTWIETDPNGVLWNYTPYVSLGVQGVNLVTGDGYDPTVPPPAELPIQVLLYANSFDETGNPAGPLTADAHIKRAWVRLVIM